MSEGLKKCVMAYKDFLWNDHQIPFWINKNTLPILLWMKFDVKSGIILPSSEVRDNNNENVGQPHIIKFQDPVNHK